VMLGRRGDEGKHPGGTPLLRIALDDGATIAKIDCHLSAFLNERFGDWLPTDGDRGTVGRRRFCVTRYSLHSMRS
jgi:hypothetical protein